MALSHSYWWRDQPPGAGDWVKATNVWIWDVGAALWRLGINQWVWDSGATWRLGYTKTAGPLDHIHVTPATADVPVTTTQQYTAVGHDEDHLPVSITPVWTISSITDSIDSSGLFTAGTVPNTCTVFATVGSVQGTAIAEVIP